MKSIVQEIEALRKMKAQKLVKKYEEVYGKAPHIKHKDWLWKRIAWKIQEQRFGGLSRVARKRLNGLVADVEHSLQSKVKNAPGATSRPRKANEPAVGTTLTRTWHGQEYHVHVLEDGYEWNGVKYRSLSGVAKAITGSHWNGLLFFGLVDRKKSK